MKKQKGTVFCFKENRGSSIQYKQSWHSKDFQLMEWAFVRISNTSSEPYISQMSWSELILWFQGNLQRGLSPSQIAKQYYSKAEFTETFSFFFFFSKQQQWDALGWADGAEIIILPGYCGQSLVGVCTCRKGALHPCICAQVTFIHTCISTCDIPSCAASKSKWCCASHTFSFKKDLYYAWKISYCILWITAFQFLHRNH